MNQQSNSPVLTKLIKTGKWFVVAAWVIVAILAFPFVSKLNNNLNNKNSLPANYQSAKVAAIEEQDHTSSSSAGQDLSVIYENRQGISATNKQVILAQRNRITAAGIKNVTSVSEIVYSPDKQAAYFTLFADIPQNNTIGVPIEGAIVTKVRQIAISTGSLTTTTAGSMAIDIDSNSANVDSLLLLSATVIVAFLLILTYRSVLLWLVPLIAAGIAIILSDAVIYVLTKHGLQVSSLDSSILIVLVFGAATDYAMLLVSRYREELHTHEDKHEAAAIGIRGSIEAISASAATVALALLSLFFATLHGTRGLGPVAAIGIGCALLVQITFLPAVLAIGGRALLWPRAPRFVPTAVNKEFTGSRLWQSVSRIVSRYPRRITIGITLVLLVCALGSTQLNFIVGPTSGLRGNPPSVQGINILDRHFIDIATSPLVVIGNSMSSLREAQTIAQSLPGTGTVSSITEIARHPSISINPTASPYSKAAFTYIASLRAKYSNVGLHDVNVGGDQAIQYDYKNIALRDDAVLIPLILLIVGIILGLLLRSIVAPILLLITVICSFAGSFGICTFIFQRLFHFQGMDPSLPIYIFLFVVALGVDYNIFLMDRSRQETIKRGTRDGMLHALRVTGGVITAAGLVLTGTFAALAQIPTVTLTEVGITIALGVLIDSFLVRSFLVPASVLMVGPKIWWPSSLSRPNRSNEQH